MSATQEVGDVTIGRDTTLTVDVPPRSNSPNADVASAATQSTPSTNSPTAPNHTENHRLSKSDFPNHSAPFQGQYDGPSSSWSTSSDKQLGSPGPHTDRIFPIRSVVSVDPSQTPHNMPGRNSGEGHEYFPSNPTPPGARHRKSTSEVDNKRAKRPQDYRLPNSNLGVDRKASTSTNNSEDKYGGGRRMELFSDAGSEQSTDRAESLSLKSNINSQGTRTPADRESLSGLVTARFKHIVTAEGHAVITGRDGDILQRCEDEPIHIPGAVQGFGLLIVLEEQEEGGDLLVRVVSENSQRIIGFSPQELFNLRSFTDILSEEQTDNLLDHVDFIRDEEADPASNGPEVFTISIRTPTSRRSQKLWCAMHINPVAPDSIICEFEIDDDQENPLVPINDDETPEPPEDTLQSNPTDEEYTESTQAMSKPLRVLRSARKRKGEAAAMEVFNIMSQVQEQLASAPNLDNFLKILVGVVKELTGFHRGSSKPILDFASI